jgi:hypothetical protein
MFKILFTLDYEIHGNGDGSPKTLMLEPTGRMMASFEKFGAKLTIMADVAEILKFKEHDAAAAGQGFSSRAIEEQLQDAVRRGHDVQLHMHASYFGAVLENGHWKQDYSLYDLTEIPCEKISRMIRRGKEYLAGLLSPVNPSYRCIAFRAANWSMHPSRNITRALVGNGILIDTSVFKGGTSSGMVNFDYSDAFHPLFPWPTDENDVCRKDPEGRLFEFPIYCEPKSLGSFLTLNRLYNHYQTRRHPVSDGFDKKIARRDPGRIARPEPANAAGRSPDGDSMVRRTIRGFTKKRPWKLDFNQCSARQLIETCEALKTRYGAAPVDVPVVLIGHSKLYTRRNQNDLERFLDYIARRAGFSFGLFSDFELDAYRSHSPC